MWQIPETVQKRERCDLWFKRFEDTVIRDLGPKDEIEHPDIKTEELVSSQEGKRQEEMARQ